MPAVGCPAPPCLLAVPRFRVAAARRRRRAACVVLRRRSARPRSGVRLVVGGPPGVCRSLLPRRGVAACLARRPSVGLGLLLGRIWRRGRPGLRVLCMPGQLPGPLPAGAPGACPACRAQHWRAGAC
eukprot:15454759-Alexandrium_andersonii.AAC.1